MENEWDRGVEQDQAVHLPLGEDWNFVPLTVDWRWFRWIALVEAEKLVMPLPEAPLALVMAPCRLHRAGSTPNRPHAFSGGELAHRGWFSGWQLSSDAIRSQTIYYGRVADYVA